MSAIEPLPFVVHVDDLDDPGDLVQALGLRAFLSGDQPWARTRRLSRLRPKATLLPPGVAPLRVVREAGRRCQLAVGDGWTLVTVRWNDRTAHLTVTARDDELARGVLAAASRGAAEAAPPEDQSVHVGFW